jgi:hypothetical protein
MRPSTFGDMSENRLVSNAYVVSMNDWDAMSVAAELARVAWLDLQCTSVFLVDDPIHCPPPGLMNLHKIKRDTIIQEAQNFIANHPTLSLSVISPEALHANLADATAVKFHISDAA